MELRESAAEAAHRELGEETGLTAGNLTLLGICPFPGGIDKDLLVLGFVSEHIIGTITPGDDAQDARFFLLSDLPPVAFRCHREIIRQYRENHVANASETLSNHDHAHG
jgi:8-oxo-dGTP pyrophosphatase MutT (NUDIX family)